MDNPALPLLIITFCSAALAVGMIGVGSLLGPARRTDVKDMPYESGMDPVHEAHRRFDFRFHLVAIAFLVFDVELLFLYPWAVASGRKFGNVPVVTTGEQSTQATPVAGGNPAAGASESELVRAGSANADASGLAVAGRSPSLTSSTTGVSPQLTGLNAAVGAGWVANRDVVFFGVALFFVLLVLGFVYDWRKGIFQWR